MLYVIMAAFAAVVLARPGVGAWRFVQAGPGRRYWLPMQWARLRWKWLARNTQLAPIDSNADPKTGTLKSRIRYPRARFSLTEHGWQVRVRTVPLVGRAECERAATHLANHWRAARVAVSQPAPGRITLRALRSDPLGRPIGQDSAPEGTYGSDPSPAGEGLRRLYLGVDEWGYHRYLPLANLSGIALAGITGHGKTTLIASWMSQLAGTACVQFAVVDGKGGSDYRPWAPRIWLMAGDSLPDAVAVLEQVHDLMRARLASVTGNAWRAGPSEVMPLIMLIIDEASTYFDVAAFKGTKDEALARRAVYLTGQLVKKGRSVLLLTVLSSQKVVGTELPTSLRDNTGLSLSFAQRTRDGSVAALGESIREFGSYCPTLLQGRVGVCTSTLPSGGGKDPYVRVRCPEVTPEAAEARAAETARFRRDPSRAALLAVAGQEVSDAA